MLRELKDKLLCPECRDSTGTFEVLEFEGAGPRIESGLLRCTKCRAHHVIHERLLEFVPRRLHDAELRDAFLKRHDKKLKGLGIKLPQIASAADPADEAQLKQRHHFDWYADNESQTYADYQQTPFWRASDKHVLARWRPRLRNARGWLLDIGCADGRGGFQLAREMPESTLIGFDISAKMARAGLERARAVGLERSSFLVADGDSPPFRDSSFDCAVTYGVLHHLPNPARSCVEIQRLLVPGGIHFAHENNKTALRPIFDALMKILPIWTEEAGAEPMMSSGMVTNWLAGQKVRLTWETSVFLPPHLFNLLGGPLASLALEATDRLAHALPVVRNQGGLILFEIEKLA